MSNEGADQLSHELARFEASMGQLSGASIRDDTIAFLDTGRDGNMVADNLNRLIQRWEHICTLMVECFDSTNAVIDELKKGTRIKLLLVELGNHELPGLDMAKRVRDSGNASRVPIIGASANPLFTRDTLIDDRDLVPPQSFIRSAIKSGVIDGVINTPLWIDQLHTVTTFNRALLRRLDIIDPSTAAEDLPY